MSDAPQPPPGWQPPPPPQRDEPSASPPPSPPRAAPGPEHQAPPGWAPPSPPTSTPPPTAPGWAAPPGGGAQPPPGATLPPPPGTPGYGYGYAPQGVGPAKPIRGLSTAVSVLVGLAGVAALAAAGALFNRAAVLEDGFLANFDDVQDADDLVAVTALFSAVSMIAAGIVWLVWHYRVAQNAETLGKRQGLSAGWAIGGWLIPLANLVLGPLQLLQSAKWSDPEAPGKAGRAPGVLVVWWVLWVVQTLISLASGRFAFGDGSLDEDVDLEEFRSADQTGGLSGLVLAAAAVAAILVVREVTRRQRAAFAARGIPAD